MYFKRVRRIGFVLTFVIAIPLFFIRHTFAFGFIFGGLISILCFEILKFTGQKARLDKLKRSLVLSRILRMSIYAASLTISLVFPAIFNFYCLFFGLFVIKLSIVVNQYLMKGIDSDGYFDV